LFPLHGNAICDETTDREKGIEPQGEGGNDVTYNLIILKGRVRGEERRDEVKAHIYIVNLSFLIILD
jgi:hypothetical protein